MFQNKVVVITGGAAGIGKCIAEEFHKQGAQVCVIDCAEGSHYVGDIGNQETLEAFASSVIRKYGRVDVLVNNAPPSFIGIDTCSYQQFQHALAVGVTAPFYLSKLFAPYFGKGASIINISSSRDRMSQPQSESYTAAKGGIAALTHALASVSPEKCGSTPFPPAGLTPLIPFTRVPMPCSSPWAVWAILWILPIWCCFLHPKKQALSPVKISVSTAVRRGS